MHIFVQAVLILTRLRSNFHYHFFLEIIHFIQHRYFVLDEDEGERKDEFGDQVSGKVKQGQDNEK